MLRLLPVILLLALTGCDPAGVDDIQPTVSLLNSNAASVHILAAGETTSEATRLGSGSTRQVAVADGERGEERFFRVIVGGSETEQIGCFINHGVTSATAVEFTAEGALVCLRW